MWMKKKWGSGLENWQINPNKTIPNIRRILENELTEQNPSIGDDWETVPLIGRKMQWGLTVRKQTASVSFVAQDSIEITSYVNAGPFKINSQNFDNAEWLWVLDPLDGTKDFIQGTQNYAMHLALNYKRKPYIGIVLIPEKDELWISYEEKIWCENRDGNIRKQNMSETNILEKMTIVTSKNHNNKLLIEFIEKLGFKQKTI